MLSHTERAQVWALPYESGLLTILYFVLSTGIEPVLVAPQATVLSVERREQYGDSTASAAFFKTRATPQPDQIGSVRV